MIKDYDYSRAFKTRLENLEQAPYGFKDSIVVVHDTLETASYIAESIFKEKVNPELTLKVYELILDWREKRLNENDDNFYYVEE